MRDTRSFHSRLLRPRKKTKSKTKPITPKSKSPKRISRVSDLKKISIDLTKDDNDATCTPIEEGEDGEMSSEFEELGFTSSKDIVWANAYPYTWWPGWIRRVSRGKLFISFFNCDRSLWLHESEIRFFEKDFEEVMSTIERRVGLQSNAIDSALAEYGRRLISELTCSCQEEFERRDSVESDSVDVIKEFSGMEVLKFVRRVALSPTFEEVESARVVRAAAPVNAFRRFAFIRRDWIYGETMRIAETGDEAEGTCLEDKRTCDVVQVEDSSDEEEKEGEEVGEVEVGEGEESEKGEEEEEDQEEENNLRELVKQVKLSPQVTVVDVFLPLEEEDELVEEENSHKEFVLVEEESDYEDFVEQLKNDPLIRNKINEEPLKQHQLNERRNISIAEVFQLMEEEEEIVKENHLKKSVEDLKIDPVPRKKHSKESLEQRQLNKRSPFTAAEEFQPVEEVVVVDEENSDDQVNIGSVSCKKNREPIGQQQMNENLQITEKKVFKPVEALAFIHRVAVSPWVDDTDTVDVIRQAANVNTFRRHVFIKQDWIYQQTMRLFENTDELESTMKSTFPEDDQTCKVAQEVNIPDEEDECSIKQFIERVKSSRVICNKNVEDPLRGLLNHLYCLALDPFYSGTERHGVKNTDDACQKMLRYKELVYRNVTDFFPFLKPISDRSCVSESVKPQKLTKVSSISHLKNTSINGTVQENLGAANEDKTQESEPLSNIWSRLNKKSKFKGKTEDVKVCSSTSNIELEDVVESVGSDVFDHLSDTAGCNTESKSSKWQKVEDVKVSCSIRNVENGDISYSRISVKKKRQSDEDAKVLSTNSVENRDVVEPLMDPDSSYISESNKRQKTAAVKVFHGISNVKANAVGDLAKSTRHSSCQSGSNKRKNISTLTSVLRPHGGNTTTLHTDSYISGSNDNNEGNFSSRVFKDHLNAKSCSEAGIGDKTLDLKAECRSSYKLDSLPGKTMFKEMTSAHCGDRLCKETSRCQTPVHGKIDLCPAGFTSGSSKKELGIGVGPGSSYVGDGNSQPITNVSLKVQQAKTVYPLTMHYSSPLSAESSASNGDAYIKSSKMHNHSEGPTTLHMKFPKDFKLPSKEELVMKFRPFGPVDYLKTKIFFYTGSAQVLFLNFLDAEAACHYAKSKKIFPGEANIRFWLGRREASVGGANNISAPSSLPTPSSLISNVKSCLRISNPPVETAKRKHLHVKFHSENQDIRSDTTETKQGAYTRSGSWEHSKDVGPDISRPMIVLLKKCDQLVTKLKDNLDIHSFYSIFTHNSCDLVMDRDQIE